MALQKLEASRRGFEAEFTRQCYAAIHTLRLLDEYGIDVCSAAQLDRVVHTHLEMLEASFEELSKCMMLVFDLDDPTIEDDYMQALDVEENKYLKIKEGLFSIELQTNKILKNPAALRTHPAGAVVAEMAATVAAAHQIKNAGNSEAKKADFKAEEKEKQDVKATTRAIFTGNDNEKDETSRAVKINAKKRVRFAIHPEIIGFVILNENSATISEVDEAEAEIKAIETKQEDAVPSSDAPKEEPDGKDGKAGSKRYY